jgi:WD40 repeat protein
METRKLSDHDKQVESIAYSPDGSILVSVEASGVGMVWDVVSGQLNAKLAPNGGTGGLLAFSPDGSTLATVRNHYPTGWKTGQGTVILWDTATWKQRCELKGHENPILALAYHPNGRFLVTGTWVSGTRDEIRCWDAAGQRVQLVCRYVRKPEWTICTLAFSPDGKRLLAGGSGGVIYLWKWEELAGPQN